VAFGSALKGRLEQLVGWLRVIARVDELTGALNRRGLLERIEREIALARETGGSCALTVLEVDP
jgi:GGDEF domain-containing protein